MSNIINNLELHNNLDHIINKYKENEYILGKLKNYITHILPITLETYNKRQIEREARKNKLNIEKDEFTERFLLKNRCSYCSHNELFILYSELHFAGYSEDDIQHQILTTITTEKNLIPWKFKIKNNIIKQIKEISPLNTIPESCTIQFVINNLYPNIFPSRNYVKYFLTIIGDCLLNKNDNKLIYLVSQNLKEFIREINNLIYTYFGYSNSLCCFKFKFYDHDYSSARLIHLNNENMYKLPQPLSKYILDLLCVATHYSSRYECADKFLEQCTELTLIEQAKYLNNHTPTKIVEIFINSTINKCTGTSITYKNMIFLWKKFIDKINIPNVIFYDTLKTLLRENLNYDETSDTFLDVTSSELPLVASFITFWDTTITDDYESDIEIDELNKIFKSFHGKSWSISDDFLIELVRHFYPETFIDDNKYILNINCSLWNKSNDIIQSIEFFKIHCINNNNQSLKSINSAYEFYSINNNKKWIASKNYFEKIIKELLVDYIDEHGIISSNWID